MKNWLKKNIFTLCSACLSLSLYFKFYASSNFLFGEPDFPSED